MFLPFQTLVNHRCKFSIPISKCPTHKFSIKINWEHIKSHLKMGVIVFDFQCFNWNQTAESHGSVFTVYSMVSIWTRGFLSDILRSEISFQRKTKQGNTSLSCNGFTVSQYYGFSLPAMDTRSLKFLCITLTYGRAGQTSGNLCFIFSIARHAIWHCCVYSAFSSYILAGGSLGVTRTSILELPQYTCPKMPRIQEK